MFSREVRRSLVLILSLAPPLSGCQPAGEATGPEGPSPARNGGNAGASATGGSGPAPAPGTGGRPAEPLSTGGAPGTGGASGGGGASTDGAGTSDVVVPAPDGAAPAGKSPGCGTMKPAGTFMISAGAAQTPYRVVLPSTYDAAKPYPVVFYLHGRGNNIEGQGTITRDVAGANLAIVVYPKSFGSDGWEVPNRDKPEENTALLRALIQHLGNEYCIDRSKIIMTGFSSGCWLASRLACTMKDQLAGVVAAGCGLDPRGKCEDRKPVTYIIGRGDGQFAGAPAAADFYRTRNGCTMTRAAAAPAPCESYAGCAAGFPTTYCAHAGGHSWPAFGGQSVVEMLEGL
jgi:polyhydroxybutyrate depolymerase